MKLLGLLTLFALGSQASELRGTSPDTSRQLAMTFSELKWEAATYDSVNNVDAGKGSCRQEACWIASSSRACVDYVANYLYTHVVKSKDSFQIQTRENGGTWVLYWRTRFEPKDQGRIVYGSCSDGAKFSVENCQPGRKVDWC